MDEISRVINTVSKVTGIGWIPMLESSKYADTHARQILCHIVVHNYPHLVPTLTQKTTISTSAILKAAKKEQGRIEEDTLELHQLNAVLIDLNLPLVRVDRKSEKKNKFKLSPTKQLFGFDYTIDEEIRMEKAIHAAISFMAKYGKGIQPTPYGRVLS